jgi:thioredoxin reductase
MKKTRVLIAGGGFAGFSAAQYFEGLSARLTRLRARAKQSALIPRHPSLDTSAQDEL